MMDKKCPWDKECGDCRIADVKRQQCYLVTIAELLESPKQFHDPYAGALCCPVCKLPLELCKVTGCPEEN